jgi:hypothetical protein
MESTSARPSGREESSGRHVCEECQASFPTADLLERHLRVTHPEKWAADPAENKRPPAESGREQPAPAGPEPDSGNHLDAETWDWEGPGGGRSRDISERSMARPSDQHPNRRPLRGEDGPEDSQSPAVELPEGPSSSGEPDAVNMQPGEPPRTTRQPEAGGKSPEPDSGSPTSEHTAVKKRPRGERRDSKRT